MEKDMVPVLLLHGLPEPHIAQLAPVEGGGVHLGWMETLTTGSGVPATCQAHPLSPVQVPFSCLEPLLILRLVQEGSVQRSPPQETFPGSPPPSSADSASSVSQLSLIGHFQSSQGSSPSRGHLREAEVRRDWGLPVFLFLLLPDKD